MTSIMGYKCTQIFQPIIIIKNILLKSKPYCLNVAGWVFEKCDSETIVGSLPLLRIFKVLNIVGLHYSCTFVRDATPIYRKIER